jgi:conjugal transfer pilus assembly protein TraD
MLARAYEMPWRRAVEAWACAIWLLALAATAMVALIAPLPIVAAFPLTSGCFVMALWRGAQAIRLMVLRAALTGRAIQLIGPAEQERLTREPEQVFLGFGFDWKPVHSQRLYELAKIDWKQFTVSPRLLRGCFQITNNLRMRMRA